MSDLSINHTNRLAARQAIPEVEVFSLNDLPTPVLDGSGEFSTITLADSTNYLIKVVTLNLGANIQLKTGIGTSISGVKNNATSIIGLTNINVTSPAILTTDGTNGFDISDFTLQQTGTAPLISVNTSAQTGTCFITTVTLFGGDILLNSGVVMIISSGTRIAQGARIVIPEGLTYGNLLISQSSALQAGSTGNVDGIVTFEKDSTLNGFSMDTGSGFFLLNTASIGVKIESGVTIGALSFDTLQYSLDVFQIPGSANIGIQVENPDSVNLGILTNSSVNIFVDGILLSCKPEENTAAVVTTPSTTDNTIGCAMEGPIGGVENLLIATFALGGDSAVCFKMQGISNTVDSQFTFNNSGPREITWHRGDLYSCDAAGGGTIFRHDGFSATTPDSITSPNGEPSGIVFINSNLVSCDDATNTIYFHDGFSTTILASFNPGNTTTLTGLAFDGINLLYGDKATGIITVLKGLNNEIQYTFLSPAIPAGGELRDLVITNDGLLVADRLANEVHVYDHPVTFDHSSATWDIMDVVGVVFSADRGGSQFNDNAGITVDANIVNVWVDVADSPSTIFHGIYSENEKCQLHDETNGELIWTGVRNRSQSLSAQIGLTLTGNFDDQFYELAVVINDIIQTDSIAIAFILDQTGGSTVFTGANTLIITRDLELGDTIKVQIRNVTTAGTLEAPACVLCKLAIS